ncbi:MAG: non-heme iron oxygenase ferredoxin subunit [Nitrosopumilus sp.]
MTWIKVCQVSELPPGEKTEIEAMGKKLLLANVDASFYAVDAICSHEAQDLSSGILIENKITCTRHLSQFDIITGEALNTPATVPLQRFEVKVEDEMVYVLVD